MPSEHTTWQGRTELTTYVLRIFSQRVAEREDAEKTYLSPSGMFAGRGRVGMNNVEAKIWIQYTIEISRRFCTRKIGESMQRKHFSLYWVAAIRASDLLWSFGSLIVIGAPKMSRPLDNVNPTIFAPTGSTTSQRQQSVKAQLWDEEAAEYQEFAQGSDSGSGEEEREEIDAEEVFGAS